MDLKKFNLDIDYKITQKDLERAPEQPSAAEMTQDYIEYAVNTSNPQGLDGKARRIWGRIQRKLSSAVENEEPFIDLESEEVSLLKKAFAEAKFPAKFSEYVVILEDAIYSL